MTSGWHVLTARVPDSVDDEIAAVLGAGSLGVEIAAAGPGMSLVRVYFGSSDAGPSWRERAAHVLSAHGLSAAGARVAIEPVADLRWVERWQASLAPIPLGTRFVVAPGELPAGETRDPIRLIPGMAFGTGEHETTRLAAAALERLTAAGSHWLDLGTGTGILAIVAARSGAARVLALDTDAEAAHVASHVVAENGASATVEVRTGSIGARSGETFDGIVANIQSSFFLSHASEVAEALRPRGVLLASGFLDDDRAEVGAALAASGLDVVACDADGPWVCVTARRRER